MNSIRGLSCLAYWQLFIPCLVLTRIFNIGRICGDYWKPDDFLIIIWKVLQSELTWISYNYKDYNYVGSFFLHMTQWNKNPGMMLFNIQLQKTHCQNKRSCNLSSKTNLQTTMNVFTRNFYHQLGLSERFILHWDGLHESGWIPKAHIETWYLTYLT